MYDFLSSLSPDDLVNAFGTVAGVVGALVLALPLRSPAR